VQKVLGVSIAIWSLLGFLTLAATGILWWRAARGASGDG